MRILTLKPTLGNLAFAAFTDGTDVPVVESTLALREFDRGVSQYPERVLQCVRDALGTAGALPPDVIGVRALFGGERFPQPVFATEAVLAELRALAPQAPLHLPQLVELLRAARDAFPGVPLALVFETAFFVDLPERERLYGLDPEAMASQSLRRFGFHGVFHEAACRDAARRLGGELPRILSICLEPRPELAACLGRRPVMVTGGNTLVEGLPGESSCGDVDPSVVLKLAHDTRWGPEGASRVLTRESGLRGLVGRAISLAALLDGADGADGADGELRMARDVFLHCVLRACGAGIAAVGGLDAIVYSGRYATSGAGLHAWLCQQLWPVLRAEPPHFLYARTLDQLVCDTVRVMAVDLRRGPS